jgi:hypothetical protein
MAPKTSPRRSASRSDRRLAAVQRRRQQATARSAAARRATRRKRRLQVLAGVAALAVAGGTTATLALRGGGSQAPSSQLRAAKVAGATGALALAADPTTYHAVYRAESYEGSKATVTTEDVTVQRPFDGRVLIKEGEPPGGTAQFEGRSSFGMYANYSSAGAAQVAGDAPTVALGDLRLSASLPDLVDQGLFVLGDRRKLLGHECQVYRTGSPLQSLKITAPTATDYVDACVDATGLLLEEVTVISGKPAQHLTATSIDFDVPVDASTFAIDGQRVGTDQGGADVTAVDAAGAPIPGYWALDAPPAGFTAKGRYLVAGANSTYMDVYVRGTDLVTVRQGAAAAEPDLSDASGGRDVDLGTLGRGKVVLGSIGPTVAAHPGSDAFVQVTGTLPGAQLQAIASALHPS